jgi:hypothetical protein
MPLQLNLLHEEKAEQRQRKRDPIKISIMIGIAITALLAVNYLWGGYRLLDLKRKLGATEEEWKKVEPKVGAAQKRIQELNNIIAITRSLDQMIDARFYWAPMLERIAHCVTPNIQLTNFEAMADGEKGVVVTLDGMAGGREPRAVAEDFRQMLLEQVGKEQSEVKVEFKTLEDLDTLVNVGGSNVATAHFAVAVSFNPYSKKGEKPAERRR